MRKSLLSITILFAITLGIIPSPRALAQSARGTITGRVADDSGGVLPSAQLTLEPPVASGFSDQQGEFTIPNVAPGEYKLTVTYRGFAPFTARIVVNSGQVSHLQAVLRVGSVQEQILVTAERPHGEAEAINRQLAADNIVQVLPSEVITSLPNANVADAIGRLPSVTLERDEGEGKYVQIRGTEPRLSNVTIDGVNVPSPESGVRQIKLDTIASDLVESVEINKTLQANMDADGIGGSVNLRTKTAGDQPTLSIYGLGGYTPIIGGRGVDQFGSTYGQRFGPDKRFGMLVGGTYDWNGRGINDIEPSPTVSSLSPHYDSIDLRDYKYYRTRWGLTGSTDYKINDSSSVFIRGLFSTFRNWGQKWVYSLNDGDVPKASMDWRRPDYAIGSLVAGGHHVFTSSWLAWDISAARSRMLASGGNGGAKFAWTGGAVNCFSDPAATATVYRPQFSPSCFTPGTGNVLDIANYQLSSFDLPSLGKSAQLNLLGSASYARNYHVGSHFGTFEFGGKVRNGHKFDDSYGRSYSVNDGIVIPVNQFAGNFTDPNYYDKSYPFGPSNVDYTKVNAFVAANPGMFTFSGGPGVNSSNYDLVERVSAGYLMNTMDLTPRLRLVAGVRFEGTQVSTIAFDSNTNLLDFKANGSYVDVLPSAALRIRISPNSDLRLVYSSALARPDPQDIAQAVSPVDTTQTPPTVSLGNPNLKAEHANNYDALYEHYLNPLGIFQAGFFYKDISDPIIATQVIPTTGPYAGYMVSQPGNAGSAYLVGFEASYQQQLSFLPSRLKGFGISANYSYTASQASGLPLRSDHPALLRQAPNTWNISPTFDRGRVSVRVGMAYNGANIFAYQYQNLNSDGTSIADSDLPAGGARGPGGDNYLYSHFQVDAQGSVRVHRGLTLFAYGLNLNNEVFGFYNGSPQYVVQREYYKPTIAGGVRWTFSREK
jgi:outer membrane receptor protein involved in Fe transport